MSIPLERERRSHYLQKIAMAKRSHSVKFSKREARVVRAAAKKVGKSLSAFIAEVATKAAVEAMQTCPTCGASG